MEEQERELILDNMRRQELWENTPTTLSGMYSDMTPMEIEKLINTYLGTIQTLERMLEDIKAQLKHANEMQMASIEREKATIEREKAAEQRAARAEKRAEAAESRIAELLGKISDLEAMVQKLLDGTVIRSLLTDKACLEKRAADAEASDRHNRAERYGRTSQKMKPSEPQDSDENQDNDDNRPSAAEEKANMAGKESLSKLPDKKKSNGDPDIDRFIEEHYNRPRPYRQGMKHSKMDAADIIEYESDPDALPEGWTIVEEYVRTFFDEIRSLVGRRIHFFICKDETGAIKILYAPKDRKRKRWIGDAASMKDARKRLSSGAVNDDDGEPIVDCVPGTSASADMMANVAIDHFLNGIPYYRLTDTIRHYGMRLCRQTLNNWVFRSGQMLQPMIEKLLDVAVTKDSVVNCDETWCRVRENGKYKKRYIWCLVNKEARIVIYGYRKGARSREALVDLLDGRMPKAIQSDGYNVYLYFDGELINAEHLCCMAHARAKFYTAWDTLKDMDAKYILDLIRKLYFLEAQYKKLRLPPEEIRKRRNNLETQEIIIAIRSKIDQLKSGGQPQMSGLLEKAVRYMDSFWTQLMAFRNDGRYTIDNTLAERFIRQLAAERKNSQFYGSHKMGEIATVFQTLISTCKIMKVSAYEYLRKVFGKIVRGCTDMTSLLPMNIGLSVNNY